MHIYMYIYIYTIVIMCYDAQPCENNYILFSWLLFHSHSALMHRTVQIVISVAKRNYCPKLASNI